MTPISDLESRARERAEQYFLDQSNDSELVFDAMTHHPAVVSVLETAPSSTDDCESGRRLGRAVAMARIKFVNDFWSMFALCYTITGQWPAEDEDIHAMIEAGEYLNPERQADEADRARDSMEGR